MILLTNGCSWTWGGGLEDYFTTNERIDHDKRESLVWPYYVGNHFQANKIINLSRGCSSNQRIVRTTFDWFLQNYSGIEPVLAIIQLTDPSRYEYYHTKNIDDFTNNDDCWAKATAQQVISNHDFDFSEMQYRHNLRMSTFTSIEGIYRIVEGCSALAKLFDRYKVQYYFWPAICKIPNESPEHLKKYSRSLNFLDYDQIWEYDRISNIDTHPSLLGHKQIADKIISTIQF